MSPPYRIKNPEGCIWYIKVVWKNYAQSTKEDRSSLSMLVKKRGLIHLDRATASEAACEMSKSPAVTRVEITRVETKRTLTFEGGDCV